ncbi:cob(I)yrinic acid a,c-diamide adenosyltransferase [Candidatus Berkelbacteria bacterium CG_4_9_14_0_2_um_filter_42_30]|uniref:Cob(I)yrinic acid a,c-diamide adenosyltransferase n=2 Tax=Candidatus Berkelbacteria TaxID=1618330 RepID=A0A1J4RSW6_9BACT|nr:MAG: cob(I)yrinic acid a,c-diamide adenosyltransferase [Candidatus Berkelbacteria bacterium CG1_02_42_45]PJC65722.1 MAG: cob(I)yrinic acid a,c-diamide adenosyltransferase [Candidatus Berkelbacteria bacterium CG_4_9_14_0_2_um_filter_42_30]
MRHNGLIIVYTGEGKGKTTAALGLAFRAAGWGERIAIIQFIKGYKKTGEWQIVERIEEIDIYQTGDVEIRAIGKLGEKDKKSVRDALKLAKKIIKEQKHKIIILDEINNALNYDLVEAGEIIKLLREKPVEQTIVLTGRGAPKEVMEIADLVTEMKNLRHPFDNGIPAKKGIDY